MIKKIRRYKAAKFFLPIVYTLVLISGITGRSFAVIAALMGSALIAGAFFCGWLCPFGFVQEMLGKLGRKLKLPHLKIPADVEKWLRFSRYILLGLTFTGLGLILFIAGPYGTFMGVISMTVSRITIAAWILFSTVLASSVFIDRPFCRYACTEGAQYGIAGMARIFTVKRNTDNCFNCGACDRKCPVQIKISDKKNIRNVQCINCFECIKACPSEGALTYGNIFSKQGVKNE